MSDFAKIYRDVAYFGIWASETADDYGRRDAAAILTAAVDDCPELDMRENRELIAALAYLANSGHEKRARAFWKSLDIEDPERRRQAAAQALAALKRDLPS